MASGQHTVGSKAEIFKPALDPLGGGLTEEQASIREAMSEEVDKRMNRALDDLKVKYATTTTARAPRDASVQRPTGAAYRQQEAERRKAFHDERARREEKVRELRRAEEAGVSRDDDLVIVGSEDQKNEDEDELETLREMRLKEMKNAHHETMQNRRKGHGEYAQIAEDQFLEAVCASSRCVVHFSHADFERCKIMDHHLRSLAAAHLEARFLKIDAAKTPFFVQKLKVQIIPTCVVFRDGVATARLVGFDGLTAGLEPGKEDEFNTKTLAKWLAKAGCLHFEQESLDDILNDNHHGNKQANQLTLAAFRAKMIHDDDDDDFLDDD